MVYIYEAHPTDGWTLTSNEEAGIEIADPATLDERSGVAQTCAARLDLSMPLLIDGMDNAVAKAFNAWPERLYVVSQDGVVLYQGGKGPFGFVPQELEAFLTRYFDG